MSACAGLEGRDLACLIEIAGAVKRRNCSLQDVAGHATGDVLWLDRDSPVRNTARWQLG
jgi:hypothetical protein